MRSNLRPPPVDVDESFTKKGKLGKSDRWLGKLFDWASLRTKSSIAQLDSEFVHQRKTPNDDLVPTTTG